MRHTYTRNLKSRLECVVVLSVKDIDKFKKRTNENSWQSKRTTFFVTGQEDQTESQNDCLMIAVAFEKGS